MKLGIILPAFLAWSIIAELKEIEPDHARRLCSVCAGKGTYDCDECDEKRRIWIECPRCKGEGKIECLRCKGWGVLTCPRCGGLGRYNKVVIEAGINGGRRIVSVPCPEHIDCSRCVEGLERCGRCLGSGKVPGGDCKSCGRNRQKTCAECRIASLFSRDYKILGITLEDFEEKLSGLDWEEKISELDGFNIKTNKRDELWKTWAGSWVPLYARVIKTSPDEFLPDAAWIEVGFETVTERLPVRNPKTVRLLCEEKEWALGLERGTVIPAIVQLGEKTRSYLFSEAVLYGQPKNRD